MIIPDANLLLYAYDEASPFHTRAYSHGGVNVSPKSEAGWACSCRAFCVYTHRHKSQNDLTSRLIGLPKPLAMCSRMDRCSSDGVFVRST